MACPSRRGGRSHLGGTVEMMIKDQPTLTLRAGDPFLIPPGTPHNALDVGPGRG
jgi:quercetin dioxygenase-like cupin family protein